MQFIAPAALVLAAVGSASAAASHSPKNVCTVMQQASLINLDLLGCSNISASVLSKLKPVSKSETCKALQDGGLINLEVLGCSNVDVNILSDGTQAPSKSASCSAKKTCSVLQEGLLNVNALGCLSLNVNLLNLGLDVNKRAASHQTKTTSKSTTPKPTATPKPTTCPAETCKILQKGGLLNLDLLGCTDININILA
ncbi:unnamed protein product [Tilletia laevis]|uniref:Hydrophobin n=2 Tax=Tilletia TaxID=13289 RepID=A0A8X7MW03_9BASI|nr:hypothetical protein CF336_g4984 [Tilletia laevis]KAE8193457.1 hypothetical protein CF328_g5045 [Tilletia controversa]KAE8257501.1 hypothetical protein A4X03_0g4644 [Tilletia caries]KAE8251500.1 hypothetical protein A4X06_0g2662 [Tilletia controversa]CAD6914276.1 unnamed protein product [Tilletia caries]